MILKTFQQYLGDLTMSFVDFLPLAFFPAPSRENLFFEEHIQTHQGFIPCCIGRNTTFIVVCNLSPTSCFLFLPWLQCFVSLLYHPRVCPAISLCLFGISMAATPDLVLSGRRRPSAFCRVLASLTLCAQSAVVCSMVCFQRSWVEVV